MNKIRITAISLMSTIRGIAELKEHSGLNDEEFDKAVDYSDIIPHSSIPLDREVLSAKLKMVEHAFRPLYKKEDNRPWYSKFDNKRRNKK